MILPSMAVMPSASEGQVPPEVHLRDWAARLILPATYGSTGVIAAEAFGSPDTGVTTSFCGGSKLQDDEARVDWESVSPLPRRCYLKRSRTGAGLGESRTNNVFQSRLVGPRHRGFGL